MKWLTLLVVAIAIAASLLAGFLYAAQSADERLPVGPAVLDLPA